MVLQNLTGSLSETFFHKLSIYIQWMLIYLKYHGMKQYISTGSLVPCIYDEKEIHLFALLCLSLRA